MILNDFDIQVACNLGLLTPFNGEQLSAASYDVALHHLVKVENPDRGAQWIDIDLREGPYKMAPGEFILAATNEVLSVPNDIACEFRLKSSRAREGFQHNLAIWIDPGFKGRPTLEISNVNRFHSLDISEGLLIGQIICHRLTNPANRSYAETGRYQNSMAVHASLG